MFVEQMTVLRMSLIPYPGIRTDRKDLEAAVSGHNRLQPAPTGWRCPFLHAPCKCGYGRWTASAHARKNGVRLLAHRPQRPTRARLCLRLQPSPREVMTERRGRLRGGKQDIQTLGQMNVATAALNNGAMSMGKNPAMPQPMGVTRKVSVGCALA